MEERISLSHGSGGKQTNNLINDLFIKYFNNEIISEMNDSAQISLDGSKRIAVTTDSFVVNPIFFNGGNIGKLAVCGTVNDLAMSGAKPLYFLNILDIFHFYNFIKILLLLSALRYANRFYP